MYPVLDIESVISHATNLFRFMEAAVRQGLMAADAGPANQGIKDENTNVLKMVLAIALTVEGSGQSDTGNRLFESVKGAADAILHSESVSIKSLPLLVLMVSFITSQTPPSDPKLHPEALQTSVCAVLISIMMPYKISLTKSSPDDVSFPSRRRGPCMALDWPSCSHVH
jgi:hypothetical protein